MFILTAILKPIAYLSLPVVLLRSVSKSSAKGRYYVRLGVYVGCMTAVATCAAFAAAAMALVGRKYDVNYVVARTFYTLVNRALELEVVVEGEGVEWLKGGKPAVMMINHQSILDILLVGRLMPRRTVIMAKKSLQMSPVGPFMMMSGALFIDRANNAGAVKSLQAAGSLMKERQFSLWMFPEGTRHSDEIPDMLPFKKGGFHLAIQAGIPIVPIVAENYWRLYHKEVFETGVIKVRVLPPVPTTGLDPKDASDLAVRVREQMIETLRDISVKAPEFVSPPPAPRSKSPTPVPVPPQTDVSLPTSLQSSSEEMYSPRSSRSRTDSGVSVRRPEPSENGTETSTETSTEEDEGMVLVGRPS